MIFKLDDIGKWIIIRNMKINVVRVVGIIIVICSICSKINSMELKMIIVIFSMF